MNGNNDKHPKATLPSLNVPTESGRNRHEIQKLPKAGEGSKRSRADRSDGNISTEKPKKKTKSNISYRDIALESLKIYIRKQNPMDIITNSEVKLLATQLQSAVVKLCLEENVENPPLITGNFLTMDGYCVVCGDVLTHFWIKSSFKSIFSLEGTDLVLLEENDLKEMFAATIFVPEPRLALNKLLPLISKLNPGINTNRWMFRNVTDHEDGSSILHVLVHKEEKEFLESRQLHILCGVGVASVRFKESKGTTQDDNTMETEN